MSENEERRHGTLVAGRRYVIEYDVTGYAFVDDLQSIVLGATLQDQFHAIALARFAARTFCEQVIVSVMHSDGGFHTIADYRHDGIGDGSCHDVLHENKLLEHLRQLREAASMPDPEDSEFFAMPCEPMAVI